MKLALISSGLGNTYRGFEISTGRWFDALRRYTDLDVRLFAGGNHPGATRVWNIPRRNWLLRPLLSLPFVPEQNRWELTYGIEEFTFFFSIIPHLLRWKPDVVWVKDVPLAHLLASARIIPGLNYKVIFANGGAFKPSNYKHFDRIQQLHVQAYEDALDAGVPVGQMELISNCIAFDDVPPTAHVTRKTLGLSDNDFVVVCVAAWNKYHKRIDYLINEVARIPDANVKLLLCGAPEADSGELQSLAKKQLGSRVQFLTVSPSSVRQILGFSNVFALASLNEGLGNALIEAAVAKIPIVAHPHGGAKFILQDPAWMTDLSEDGNLAARLIAIKNSPPSTDALQRLSEEVSARFSDKLLASQFEQMVNTTAQRITPRTVSSAGGARS